MVEHAGANNERKDIKGCIGWIYWSILIYLYFLSSVIILNARFCFMVTTISAILTVSIWNLIYLKYKKTSTFEFI